MKLKVSNELRNKISKIIDIKYTNIPVTIMNGGMLFKVASASNEILTRVCFNRSEKKIQHEAIEWCRRISTYFTTSYETYKIDIGRLKGVYPINYNEKSVEFSIDFIDKESWQDWFVQEGV